MNNSWNEQNLQEIANIHASRGEFQNKNRLAYLAALRLKLLNKICTHMKPVPIILSDNDILCFAAQCKTQKEFKKNNKYYNAARSRKMLQDINKSLLPSFISWNLDLIKQYSSKFNNRHEFKKNAPLAYAAAIRIKALDEVCTHMHRSKKGFKTDKPALLYYIKIHSKEGVFYKIGITNNSVKIRFKLENLQQITVIYSIQYLNGMDALQKEQSILKQYKAFKYTGPKILKNGNTELFTSDILGYDTKYKPGNFTVKMFDKFGHEIGQRQTNSYSDAENLVSNSIYDSYVITRTISNSKDKNNKWDYKDDNG